MDFISLELQKSKEQFKILHERYYNANKHSPDFNWQEYSNEGAKLAIIEKYKNVLESLCNDNSTLSTNRNKTCFYDSFPLIFNMLRHLENRLNSIELKGELKAELKEDKDKEELKAELKAELIKMSNKSELRELAKTVYESIKMDLIWHRHLVIDEEGFNRLNEYHKLYVLKKHIMKGLQPNFKNDDFLYNTFKQHPNILIELLEFIIINNNLDLFTELFTKGKRDIILKKDVYKKLLDISSRFIPSYAEGGTVSHNYNNIITHYETEDMLFNNDDDEIIEKVKVE